MLIAHLPAGYLLARAWPKQGPALTGAALVGAVLPDLDFFWQHVIDHSWIHHHQYWIHIPGFWAMVAAGLFPLLALTARRALPLAAIFFAAIFLHLLLDGLVGGIAWKWPVTNALFVLIEIPLVRSHWIWDFVLHWTFAAEIAICAAAGFALLNRRRLDVQSA